MATLTVGAGMQYASIEKAVAASHNGDVVLVTAGTYTNDFVQIDDNITLQSVGGMATIEATVPPSNLKGIVTIGNGSDNPDVTINGFVLSGATISAQAGNNGAGIRYQSGTLVLNDDLISNNQDGLLATPGVANTGTVLVNHSEFADNGAGDGYTHNLYIGHVAQFTFENSVSTGARVGHDIKSRALSTDILNSTISDGPNGTASYEIDLPNGGSAVIQGNTIEQGPLSQNPVIISYGEEGALQPGSLVVSGNTILNDLTSHRAIAVRNSGTAPANINGNSYWGLSSGQLASGPATLSNNVSLTVEPKLSTPPPWAQQGGPPGGTKDPAASGSTVTLGGVGTLHYTRQDGRPEFIAGGGGDSGAGTKIKFSGISALNAGEVQTALRFIHGLASGDAAMTGSDLGNAVRQLRDLAQLFLKSDPYFGPASYSTVPDGAHTSFPHVGPS